MSVQCLKDPIDKGTVKIIKKSDQKISKNVSSFSKRHLNSDKIEHIELLGNVDDRPLCRKE